MQSRFLSFSVFLLLSSCQDRNANRLPAGETTARRLNVVLVTIDTLRADRLGCYGNSKIETPNLDTLARKGVLFENAVTHTPLTAPSHASLFTGLYPTMHKVRDTGGFVLQTEHPALAAILQKQGWDTAAFVGASVLKRRFGFNQGFATYDDQMGSPAAGSVAEPERRAGEVVDGAIRWLDTQSGKPYFLWVHVFDPHLPYDPPAPFREKYKERPYDGEVAYTDQQIGRLMESVSKKSPAESTLFVVLADHGESFSEHGEYAHGVFLYDTTLRIPMLMAGAGVPAGLRVKQQVRMIDVLPTLLELAGMSAPAGIQGRSVAPALAGKTVAMEDSYEETLFPKINMGWAELRGLRTARWKYIRAPKPELYDLQSDAGEQTNVVANHPAEVQELESKLAAIVGTGVEKVEPTPMDPKTLIQLRSLGYVGGSTPQQYALNGRGVDPKERKEVLRLLHEAMYANAPLPQRIEMMRKAVALDPVNPTLYNNLGNLYAQGGRNEEALQLYEEALKKGVESAWLFSRIGHLYLKQGRKAEAVPHFEKAAQLNPSDYDSLQNLAVVYREQGRLADAERVLDWIVKSGEEYGPAYNELGMVAFQKGDRVKALSHFEKAASLDATYQLNLGRLYRMMGDNAKARAAFENFLGTAGGKPEYRQLVPEVQKELAATPR